MFRFDRNLDSKEALSIGTSTWVEFRIKEVLKKNLEDPNSPVIIEKIRISEQKDLRIYILAHSKKIDAYSSELYVSKLFKENQLGHLFEENFQFNFFSFKDEIYLECQVKEIYKHSLKDGATYLP